MSTEIKTFTLEDHLKKGNEKPEIFSLNSKEKFLSWTTGFKKNRCTWYIGYKIRYQNFCSVEIFKEKIKIFVRCPQIEDPLKLFKKVPSNYGWGRTHLWFGYIKNEKEMDYAMTIVRQSYDIAPDK